MRQSNKASGTSQGPEQNRKIVRPQCLDGVATMNIVKWQLQTTLWPDNMLTLSRQNCLVPSSAYWYCTILINHQSLLQTCIAPMCQLRHA